MWVAKIRLVHSDCITSQLTKKYGITNLVYGLGYYEDEKYLYFNCLSVPRGEDKKIEAFIREVRKDKRIIRFEQSGNMFFTLIKEPKKNRHLIYFYDPRFFYLKPNINTSTGHEIYEIASWDKKILQGFIDMTKKYMQGEILKLKEEKNTGIFFPHVTTDLTSKQTEALSLAKKYGYYDVPRKITHIELAKIAKTPKSTFQGHLRMAEKKIMPFLINQVELLND